VLAALRALLQQVFQAFAAVASALRLYKPPLSSTDSPPTVKKTYGRFFAPPHFATYAVEYSLKFVFSGILEVWSLRSFLVD